MVAIVPVNVDLEQGVSTFVIGDFFISPEADQAILESAKAAFDFALGVGCELHPMQPKQNSSLPLPILSIRCAAGASS